MKKVPEDLLWLQKPRRDKQKKWPFFGSFSGGLPSLIHTGGVSLLCPTQLTFKPQIDKTQVC